MKSFKSNMFLLSMLSLLLLVPSVLFAESEKKIEKAYPLSRDGRIYLENESGDIVIKNWQRDEIKVSARKVGWDEESLDRATVDINRTGSSIRIITRYEEPLDPYLPVDVSVHYELFVPAGAQVRVKSSSGAVRIMEIGGRTDIETVSGRVEVVKAGQGVKCKTIGGEIYLEEITGGAALESTSGKISVEGISGAIEANSVSGDISIKEFSSADEVTIETIKGDMEIQGELSSGGIYELNTISGRIELLLPAASEFELQLNTVNGDMQCDFEVSEYAVRTRNRLQGVVGRGGAMLKMSSLGGDILINRGR